MNRSLTQHDFELELQGYAEHCDISAVQITLSLVRQLEELCFRANVIFRYPQHRLAWTTVDNGRRGAHGVSITWRHAKRSFTLSLFNPYWKIEAIITQAEEEPCYRQWNRNTALEQALQFLSNSKG